MSRVNIRAILKDPESRRRLLDGACNFLTAISLEEPMSKNPLDQDYPWLPPTRHTCLDNRFWTNIDDEGLLLAVVEDVEVEDGKAIFVDWFPVIAETGRPFSGWYTFTREVRDAIQASLLDLINNQPEEDYVP